MSKTIKYVLLGLLGALVLIQLFPANKTNPPVSAGQDFLTLTSPDAEMAGLIKNTCYDCHSHETNYPWYASVAPISWWTINHVNEGRENLNFSTWGANDSKKKAHQAEECAEVLSEGEMPLKSYLITHAEARLSEAQRSQMATWFMALAQGGNSQPNGSAPESSSNDDDDHQ